MSFEHDELIRMKRKSCLLFIIISVLAFGFLSLIFIFGLGISDYPVFDIVVVVAALFLSIISITMIVRYVAARNRNMDIKFPAFVIPLLIFSAFLWLVLLGTGNSRDYLIYKANLSLLFDQYLLEHKQH